MLNYIITYLIYNLETAEGINLITVLYLKNT